MQPHLIYIIFALPYVSTTHRTHSMLESTCYICSLALGREKKHKSSICFPTVLPAPICFRVLKSNAVCVKRMGARFFFVVTDFTCHPHMFVFNRTQVRWQCHSLITNKYVNKLGALIYSVRQILHWSLSHCGHETYGRACNGLDVWTTAMFIVTCPYSSTILQVIGLRFSWDGTSTSFVYCALKQKRSQTSKHFCYC